MNIELTETSHCNFDVLYTASSEEILNTKQEVLQIFKNLPVPGFRKNKATLQAIGIHYKDQINDALKRSLAENAYHNTINEKKLKIFGNPDVKALDLRDGKFECKFSIKTKPDFTLGQYKDLEIPKPHEKETIGELSEKMMHELRTSFGEVKAYEEGDTVQTTDTVIIKYDAFENDVKIQHLSAESLTIKIGSSLLPGFDENMIGMKTGETRKFNVVIPNDSLPSMAGKTLLFEVCLLTGTKNTLAEINDDLAKKLGLEDQSKIKDWVSGMATAKIEDLKKSAIKEAINNCLISNNEIKVPNWMYLSEAKYLAQNSQLEWDPLPNEDKEKFIDMAIKNTKLALVLDKIREEEPDAQLSDQETLDIIKTNIAKTKTEQSIDDIMQNMQNNGYMQVLFQRIKDEFTLDFIVKSVKIIE